MPFLILTYLTQALCAVHAVRRGAPYMLVFMILAFPVMGCAIYLVAVLIPEWSNSRSAWQAKNTIRKKLDPGRGMREAAQALEVSDTVENRLRMADQLVASGDGAAAVPLYQGCLDGTFAENPEIMLKLARAQFDSQEFYGAKATLGSLIAQNPEYRSDEGLLLFARTLEAVGEIDTALNEYDAVCGHFSGPEARCYYGLALERLGRKEEAEAQFQIVVDGARHVTAKLRERHKNWLTLAAQKLR